MCSEKYVGREYLERVEEERSVKTSAGLTTEDQCQGLIIFGEDEPEKAK
jgi:hypothetical protein